MPPQSRSSPARCRKADETPLPDLRARKPAAALADMLRKQLTDTKKANDMKQTQEKHDYEIARDELRSLYDNKLPQGKVVRIGTAVDTSDGRAWKHTAWTVLIGGVSFDYKTGEGIKSTPEACEVLAAYCRDGRDADCAYGDWCSDFGYDEDSRKALETYLACQEGGRKALRVIKDRKLFEAFADLSSRL